MLYNNIMFSLLIYSVSFVAAVFWTGSNRIPVAGVESMKVMPQCIITTIKLHAVCVPNMLV